MNKIEEAKYFASKKFTEAGERNHFIDVFTILKDEFHVSDQNVLIAGLLHDTLEDTATTYEEVTTNFSPIVADLVQEVSHPKNYNHEQRLEYYEKIKNISLGAKFIKMADFTSHLRSFIKIYERGEAHLRPKFTNNDKYIASIRGFLKSCEDSVGKRIVLELTNKLESLL